MREEGQGGFPIPGQGAALTPAPHGGIEDAGFRHPPLADDFVLVKI